MPRHTSKEMAELAGRVLNDKNSSETAIKLAGSVLSQYAPQDPRAAGQRRTSEEMAELASQVLNDGKSSETAKKLAGSVLSQREPPDSPPKFSTMGTPLRQPKN